MLVTCVVRLCCQVHQIGHLSVYLSSVNLLHYDEWKDTDLVETMIAFLDAVMEDFIEKLEALRDHDEKRKASSVYLYGTSL